MAAVAALHSLFLMPPAHPQLSDGLRPPSRLIRPTMIAFCSVYLPEWPAQHTPFNRDSFRRTVRAEHVQMDIMKQLGHVPRAAAPHTPESLTYGCWLPATVDTSVSKLPSGSGSTTAGDVSAAGIDNGGSAAAVAMPAVASASSMYCSPSTSCNSSGTSAADAQAAGGCDDGASAASSGTLEVSASPQSLLMPSLALPVNPAESHVVAVHCCCCWHRLILNSCTVA